VSNIRAVNRRRRRHRQPGGHGWWYRVKDYGGFLILAVVLVAAASYFPVGGASGNLIAVDGDSLRPRDGGAATSGCTASMHPSLASAARMGRAGNTIAVRQRVTTCAS
jgi:hypothetical protein